jgi:exonuclease SbcD
MPLRLLHTADWHLGHTLHDFDRAFEHERLLAWLIETIEREQVDALLVAGDVFDAANPPTAAQAAWYGFLVEAWARNPTLQVVVLGGNHDSAARLEAVDPFLLAMKRLHLLGGVRRKDGVLDLDRFVVPLHDRSGEVRAWVAAVPYLRASETGTGGDDAVARGTADVFGRVLDIARSRRQDGQSLLVMGHLHAAGGQVSDLSERKVVVGNQVAIPVDIFPTDVAYTALGHLHLAQAVGGRENVRYSGSLLPLALSERTYPHQVVLVEVDGNTAVPRAIPVPRIADILQVPASGLPGPVEAVLRDLARLPARGEGLEPARPFLRVNIAVDRPDPTLRQRVVEALEGKEARLAQFQVTSTGKGEALGDVEVRSITDLTPDEVFRAKYRREYGQDVPAELVQAFHELVDQVGQEGA